jgi:hypothetical protein
MLIILSLLFFLLITILVIGSINGLNHHVSAQVLTKFSLQTSTVLHETDQTFDFVAGYWNNDTVVDIIAIKKSNTDTQRTELHVLDWCHPIPDIYSPDCVTIYPFTDGNGRIPRLIMNFILYKNAILC